MYASRPLVRGLARCASSFSSTIYALSSGKGKCGVAVIRVSGSNASDAIAKMTASSEMPKPRMAALKQLRDPETREKLDHGLVLWFPGPKSFTGEDCCELQVHGGLAVVASVLTALGKLDNFRPAEPGEFTKRAFLNGKLDLTEVEGLADLIHAETEMQRKQAFLQMNGNLSKLYNDWRRILLRNVAHIEAYIDFGEDDEIESRVLDEARKECKEVMDEIEAHLADGRRGERLRYGVKTTIVGEPNAGKSTLLNTLSQRPAAIVTPIPGTTRDLIELHININGYPVLLTDTAGLRKETSDVIEIEGISRTHAAVRDSDLVLVVIDSTALRDSSFEMTDFLGAHAERLNLGEVVKDRDLNNEGQRCVFVFNKIDLLSKEERSKLEKGAKGIKVCGISCTTGEGLTSFVAHLTQHLEYLCGRPSEENPSLTQARHRHHLSKCSEHLAEYMGVTEEEQIPIAAHELREALKQIGRITGEVRSEEILDVIFKDFCIGK